jgi:hypothetical protein
MNRANQQAPAERFPARPLVVAALLALSCGKPLPPAQAPPAAAPAPAADPDEAALPPWPAPKPSLPVVDHPEVRPLKIVGRHVGGGFETLRAEADVGWLGYEEVRIEGAAGPRPWCGVDGEHELLIRRPVTTAVERLLVRRRASASQAAETFHFELPARADLPSDPKVLARWARALSNAVSGTGEWGRFASTRLHELYIDPYDERLQAAIALHDKQEAQKKAPGGKASAKGKPAARPANPPARAGVTPPRHDPSLLSNLMDTTTSVTSLQETLQGERRLLAIAGETPSVPLIELKGPPIAKFPWPAMTAALGRPVPEEPLAAAAPADFAFLRFRSLPAMFELLDRVEGVLRPAATWMDDDGRRAAIAERYEAELGIGRGPLARRFGPDAVTDVAVVGSDPYLREGSDVTLIFRVKSSVLFEAGLAAALGAHAKAHGALSTSAAEHNGVPIRISTSADGAVHQHRAHVGPFELVGNSRGALARVIDAAAGRAPRLADEPDFRYMLARDAGVPADALAFMSDRFVATVVGPRQKILEARRQIALAELQRPAFAALLYGWVYGRSPASTDELVSSGLLRKEELAHADGRAIAFSPGQAPSSAWGRPAALVPLADLGTPDKVTPSEAEAYRMFSSGYESYWRTYLDPVAVRAATNPKNGAGMTVDVRVLPIIDGTDYSHLARTVGEARIESAGARRGAQMTVGLGADAELRRDLRASTEDVPLVGRIDMDWLGGWATLGMDDALWGGGTVAPDSTTVRESQSRLDSTIHLLHELPLFASVDVARPAAAALFMAGARKELERAAPGMIQWREGGRERDVPFVRINGGAGASSLARGLDEISVYYAFCKDELLFSLSERTLRRRIDGCLEGRRPRAAAAAQPGGAAAAQATFETDARADGPLARFVVSELKRAAAHGQYATLRLAEAVLRGAPELEPERARALARALFATDVATPTGAAFVMTEDGPAGAGPGSGDAVFEGAGPTPAERAIVETLSHFRSDVAFDPEPASKDVPATRSLHVRLRLGAP